ncbi:heme biosynthesis operon protein HemX [Vibrio cincinnatiensis]|uniref:uroporphyrinogen-III C-methyltransferase n=1 Tax=Vibrio cincinnatiensis TaxID=675 RepID=UPI0012ACE392|nr:uroporphyrinogen-III C-methyltransferase [Vibrio cincinnatiensis]MCG3725320.1 heme biosynthesis operon protein HemX [Vibrio cincinnatiensis]MCG3735907.1 heme biosynthesis operon protein HemX [Vibrio cincinnatiensis]MCG3746479.1 heme biosynthesis operon protein HemX [Vibrio cincinnatiensis]MCG3766979.1 heme biosynthesis operon protein HemX [Vibrio cincinnatiensis]
MTDKKNNPPQEPEKIAPALSASSDVSPQSETKKQEQEKVTSSTSSTSPSKPKNPPSSQPTSAKSSTQRGTKLATIAIVLTILFSGGLTLHFQQQQTLYQAQLDALRTELNQARQGLRTDLDTAKQDAINAATEIANRSEVELSQQHKSIESLQLAVADITGRRPNDWLLAEADYLVKLAGRKLFLEQDAESATLLMESADQRIAELNDPSLTPLRKAMAHDITQLKAIPFIDKDGLVLTLISLQQWVDQLPLANAILPETAQAEQVSVSKDIADWQSNLMSSLKAFGENFITFRVRDGQAVPLLSPQQHFYLRENLKAKLETAIKAVYGEQQEVYHTTLTTAKQWSEMFFNLQDNQVKTFNQSLTTLADKKIEVIYPQTLASQQPLADVIRERLRRSVSTMTTKEDTQ